MQKKPKLFCIVGPTATGKSDFAVKLAKDIGGEIISADSRQIYRGLDLASGKVPRDKLPAHDQRPTTHDYFYKGFPHYMLDVANIKTDYSVEKYTKQARKIIEQIIKKGKTPIICGGTGFYIDSLIFGTEFPKVKENKTLRKSLSTKSLSELGDILKKLDKETYARIDTKNKVRLIRAIEIATELGSVPKVKQNPLPYEIEWIGLNLTRGELEIKIKKRLENRLRQGMIQEIENLHNQKVSWSRLEDLGLEPKWIALYLQNKISKEEMKEGIIKDSLSYAKRQMTWFKRNKNIKWL